MHKELTTEAPRARRMRWSVVSLALLVAWPAARVAGQEPDCRRRVLAVSIVDKQGEVVSGLTAADFRGEFRGQPIPIDSSTMAAGPKRIVIVLDARESTTSWTNKWSAAVQAGLDATQSLPVEHPMALVLLMPRVVRVIDFTQGRQAIADQITAAVNLDSKEESPRAKRPRLADAIVAALTLLGSPLFGDVVFLITDRSAAQKDLEEQFQRAGIRLFAFYLPVLSGSSVMPEKLPMTLELPETVEATGGEFAEFDLRPQGGREEQAFARMTQRLYAQMLWPYRIELTLQGPVRKPDKWTLEVVDARGKKRKGLTVRYPQRLVPCEGERRK